MRREGFTTVGGGWRRDARRAAGSRFDDDLVWRRAASPWTRLRIAALLDLLPRDAGSLLDVGCGDGQFAHAARAILGTGAQVVGIDRGRPGLERFRGAGGAVAGSAEVLPFRDGSFDVVVCSEVLEHLPEPVLSSAARELARVCRGDIVISVPDREDLRREEMRCPECGLLFQAWGHVHSFELSSIDRLFPGFRRTAEGTAGPRRPFHPRLIRVRRALGRYAFDPTAVCPRCGNHRFRDPRWDPVTLLCRGLNLLFSPRKREYWLLARYRRNGTS